LTFLVWCGRFCCHDRKTCCGKCWNLRCALDLLFYHSITNLLPPLLDKLVWECCNFPSHDSVLALEVERAGQLFYRLLMVACSFWNDFSFVLFQYVCRDLQARITSITQVHIFWRRVDRRRLPDRHHRNRYDAPWANPPGTILTLSRGILWSCFDPLGNHLGLQLPFHSEVKSVIFHGLQAVQVDQLIRILADAVICHYAFRLYCQIHHIVQFSAQLEVPNVIKIDPVVSGDASCCYYYQ